MSIGLEAKAKMHWETRSAEKSRGRKRLPKHHNPLSSVLAVDLVESCSSALHFSAALHFSLEMPVISKTVVNWSFFVLSLASNMHEEAISAKAIGIWEVPASVKCNGNTTSINQVITAWQILNEANYAFLTDCAVWTISQLHLQL